MVTGTGSVHGYNNGQDFDQELEQGDGIGFELDQLDNFTAGSAGADLLFFDFPTALSNA